MATPQSMANDSPMPSINTQPVDQYFASSHYALSKEGQSPNVMSNPMTPTASIPPTPGSLAGRKRSRGDVFANDEDLQPDGSLPTPEAESFAQGMSAQRYDMNIVHPRSAAGLAQANGQMDVLVESACGPDAFRPRHISRPSISSRKSQRVDNSAPEHNDLAQLVLPNEMREATTQPLIDEATRTLGISWTRMDSSDSLLISQAAYSKFIQNHYSSLKDVNVWFEYTALPAYLVSATNAYSDAQEFYLFSNDLLEARLVTRDPSALLPRLQLLPAIELAAPGGHIRAETDSATASQNEVNNVLEASNVEASKCQLNVTETVAPRGRSADPAHRFRELLCTAHEMELD